MYVPPDASIEVAPPPGVRIRRCTAEDAPRLAPLLVNREPLAPRVARGDVGLVAELDGHLIGCTWLAGGPLRMPFSRKMIRPRPDERYTYGGYVLPEFRRRGVHSALIRARLLEAQRLGARRLFSHVSAKNRAAIAELFKSGAIPCHESFDLVLLSRHIVPVRRRRL
jgi:GNAT superfamily N-acetyltransferase